MTVDENGNKYLRVYIKTESKNATITLGGKNYKGITDRDERIEDLRTTLLWETA